MPTIDIDWRDHYEDRHLVITSSTGQRHILCDAAGRSLDTGLPCRACTAHLFAVHSAAFPGDAQPVKDGTRIVWSEEMGHRHAVVIYRNGQREPLCAFTGHSNPPGTPCRACLGMLYRAHDEALAVYV